MNKLTLGIEYSDFLNKEVINYLNSINGINHCEIDSKNNKIYVEYDSSIISIKVLKIEILLYLDLTKTPSIISFDKHNDAKSIRKHTIIIKDLCCEYCLKGMIEDLLEIEGIESAHTDFDYINKSDINIFITYNSRLINNIKIKKLEEKFNEYY